MFARRREIHHRLGSISSSIINIYVSTSVNVRESVYELCVDVVHYWKCVIVVEFVRLSVVIFVFAPALEADAFDYG